jgi:GT2 family glycosyltransferase
MGSHVADGRATMSVVICAYSSDRWPLLVQAVASIAKQTRPVLQVLVVIDHNECLASRARAELEAVTVVENEESRGLSGARNTGVRHATGTVVGFIDDDATADAGWAEEILREYEDPTVIGTGGPVVPSWASAPPDWLPEEFYWAVGCSYRGVETVRRSIRNPIGANMSFRREVIVEAGGFVHEIGRIGRVPRGCEETELAIRAIKLTHGRIMNVPTARVDHLVLDERATWSYFASRCWAEGLSKAVVASLVGSERGLSAEKRYVTHTLSKGVIRGLRDAMRGDRAGAVRALTIAGGLAITTAGYAKGTAGNREVSQLDSRTQSVWQGHDGPPSVAPRVPVPLESDSGLEDSVVVICTHDAARFDHLRAAVASVEALTSPPDEIIVVVDHNETLLERVREEFPRVRSMENASNQGLSGARNTGIQATGARLVAFLDDDATVEEGWLARLAAPFDDQHVMVTGGGVDPNWMVPQPGWFPDEFGWVIGCSYRGLPESTTEVRNVFGGNMMVRRTAFEQVGAFEIGIGRVGSRLFGCEETELCIRIRQNIPDARVILVPEARIRHLVSSDRVRFSYYIRRCYREGGSKAAISRLVGRSDALLTERSYVRTTLPRGVAESLRIASKPGHRAPHLGRAAAIVAGASVASAGFLAEVLRARKA